VESQPGSAGAGPTPISHRDDPNANPCYRQGEFTTGSSPPTSGCSTSPVSTGVAVLVNPTGSRTAKSHPRPNPMVAALAFASPKVGPVAWALLARYWYSSRQHPYAPEFSASSNRDHWIVDWSKADVTRERGKSNERSQAPAESQPGSTGAGPTPAGQGLGFRQAGDIYGILRRYGQGGGDSPIHRLTVGWTVVCA
jgi:hypothetical protein